MTRSPSTTSRAASVMLEPTSPGSLSTVTTSSSATFSCLPPQRTIAYTRELSLSLRFLACLGTPVSPRQARLNVHRGPRSGLLPTAKVTRRQRLHELGSFGCPWFRLAWFRPPPFRPACFRLALVSAGLVSAGPGFGRPGFGWSWFRPAWFRLVLVSAGLVSVVVPGLVVDRGGYRALDQPPSPFPP